MIVKTGSGLAVYAEMEDLSGANVRIRRCYGNPARVRIEARDLREASSLDSGVVAPELDLVMAVKVRDALDKFIRRACVHDDAGLPKKRLSR